MGFGPSRCLEGLAHKYTSAQKYVRRERDCLTEIERQTDRLVQRQRDRCPTEAGRQTTSEKRRDRRSQRQAKGFRDRDRATEGLTEKETDRHKARRQTDGLITTETEKNGFITETERHAQTPHRERHRWSWREEETEVPERQGAQRDRDRRI